MSDSSVKRSKSKNGNNPQVMRVLATVIDSIVCICGLVAACSFLIPVYQAYLWFEDGVWKPLTTKIIFRRIMPTEFYHWLMYDSSWLGLKKIVWYIVSDMSLFLFIFLLGFGMFLFVGNFYTGETFAEETPEEKKRKAIKPNMEI